MIIYNLKLKNNVEDIFRKVFFPSSGTSYTIQI